MIEIFVTIAIIVLDRLSKLAATAWLMPLGSVPLWPGVFHLSYHVNTGAAFSLLSGKTFILGLISLLVSIALGFYLYRNRSLSLLSRLGLTFILGGAIGNGIDRLFYGGVVDFFDFRLINFAVFNVADSFITVGVGLLLLGLLIFDKEHLQ